MRQTFTALKYRNYRLWFFGQMVSLLGTWMQSTAQGYLIFELTQSPAYLGYVTFCVGFPVWFFMLYGGVVADRMSRRKLLIITQLAMMVLALILAFLAFEGVVRPWHILLLALGLGVASSFDAPARQAFVLELVDRKDLTNAIALNSIMFNTATMVGPAVGGMIYALYGPGWCFLINAVSFLAIIAPLGAMKLLPRATKVQSSSTVADLKAGLHYAFTHEQIRSAILILAMTTLFGFSFATLIPAWAVKVLGGDARTAGFLLSARGLGSVLSGLFLASLGRAECKGRLLVIGTFTFPVTLLVFGVLKSEVLSMVALVAVGASLMLVFNVANAMIQSLAPDEFRGRVMSIHGLTFFGLMPVSGLLAGFLAELFGEAETIIVSAIVLLVSGLVVVAMQPNLKDQP